MACAIVTFQVLACDSRLDKSYTQCTPIFYLLNPDQEKYWGYITISWYAIPMSLKQVGQITIDHEKQIPDRKNI